MKRSRFRQIAKDIAEQMVKRGYAYWKRHDENDVLTPEYFVEGKELNVEIQKLECNDEYVLLCVSVDDGGFIESRFPVAVGVRVYRESDVQNNHQC